MTALESGPGAGENRRRLDLAVSGGLFLLGVGFVLAARGEGIGTLSEPGPGFFPQVVGIVLVAASLASVWEDVRGGTRTVDADDEDFEGETQWLRVLGIIGVAALAALCTPLAGFVTSISVGLVVMAKVAGVTGWWRPLALGAAFGLVAWLVFIYWLLIPLPAGVLGTV